MSFWICDRCGNVNEGSMCRNPYCQGEPVSRTITDAQPKTSPWRPESQPATTPAARSPYVFKPERQCYNRNGTPKLNFATFDEAQDAVTTHRDRGVHAYRCQEHGWHLGSARDASMHRSLPGAA